MADTLTAADDLALGPPYVVGANTDAETVLAPETPEVAAPDPAKSIDFSKDEKIGRAHV